VKVHLNGRLVAEAEARLAPDDRGFLLGDGVFETMRAYGGRCAFLDEHLARLRRGCDALRLPFPGDLPARLDDTLRANGLREAALRVTLSRGPGGRGASPRGAGPPTVLVTAAPVPPPREAVRLATARHPHVAALPGVKTIDYAANVVARLEAEDAGADEALLLDAEGRVVECAQANLFAVRGDALLTPPLSRGCLPGVTRGVVLELAPEAGLRGVERDLTPADLRSASEVFLTASVSEIVPAVSLDHSPLGAGRPWPAAAQLHRLYRKRAQAEQGH
jgi:branched-subunit amino acid aminotransferase/4-amino-4-deoxychorismate lyase